MLNKIFGRWTVTSLASPYINPSNGYEYPRYLCTCECGKIKAVRESSLKQGDSQSCGCLQAELASTRLKVHGHTGHELFNRWLDMHRRCYDSRRKDYKHYGGRGISICDEWRGEEGFKTFASDMYSSYEKGLEIDRIDTNGNYELSNCKWSTRREQVINRRPFGKGDAHFIEFDGKRLCMSQWAEVTGISSRVISDRITKLKWSVEKALTTPVRRNV